MALWVPVDGFRDGQSLEQDVLNKTMEQLRERTDWLRDKLLSLTGSGDFESVRISDVPLITSSIESATLKAPELFEFVYLDVSTKKFAKAIATPETQENTEYIRNGNASYTTGLLIEKDAIAGTGTVVLSGKVLGLLPNGSIYRVSDFLEEGEVFRDGPYYLSSSAYGKVTATVTASSIYVGYFVSKKEDITLLDYIIISPQYRELQQMHSHQVFPLYCQPAGDSFVTNNSWYILGFPPVYYDLTAGKISTQVPCSGKIVTVDNELINTDIEDAEYEFPATSTIVGDYIVNYTRYLAGETDYYAKITQVANPYTPKIQFTTDVETGWLADDTIVIGKNRLIVGGGWLGSIADEYILTVGTATSKAQKPTTFDDCYLYWSTKNESELPGRVRLRSYDVGVPVGSQHEGKPSILGDMLIDYNITYLSDSLKGKTLTNLTTGAVGTITGNDSATHTIYAIMTGGQDSTDGTIRNTWKSTDDYRITGFPSGGLMVSLQNLVKKDYSIDFPTSEASRTWRVQIPEQVVGWASMYSNQYMDETVTRDAKLSFVTFTDGKVLENGYYSGVNVHYRRLFSIPYNLISGTTNDAVKINFNYSPDDIAPINRTYAFRFYEASPDEIHTDQVQAEIPGSTVVVIPVKYVSSQSGRIDNLIAAVKDPANHVLYADEMMLFNMSGAVENTGWLVVASKRYLKTIGTDYITDDSGLTVTSPVTGTETSEVTWSTAPAYSDLKIIVTDNYNNLLYYDISGSVLSPYYTLNIGSAFQLNNLFYVMAIPYDSNGDAMVAIANNISYDDEWKSTVYSEGVQASYKYMIGFHQALNALYPPVPTRASTLLLDGINQISIDAQPGSKWKAYKAGLQSIYWYGDSYTDQPWSDDWKSVRDQGSNARTCMFHFVRLDIGDVTAVTSLQPASVNSPIKIYKCGTLDKGVTGDLSIDIELKLTDEKTSIAGPLVYKSFEGMTLKTGYVVEKIVAGKRVTLTQLDGLLPTETGTTKTGGTIKIDVADLSTLNIGYFDDVSLLNAKQEIKGLFSFVSLLPYNGDTYKIPSGFLAKFRTPINLPEDKIYKLKFYFTVFGTKDNASTTDSKVAGLNIDYSICKDIRNSSDSLDTLISDIEPATALVTFAPSYEAYNPFMFTNNVEYKIGDIDIQTISLEIGNIESRDTVALKISTMKPTSGTIYDGNVGFLAMSWELVEV